MRPPPGVLSMCLFSLATGRSLASPEAITLTAGIGPDPAEIVLQWSGSQPVFEVYRSTVAASVVAPPNLLAESDSRQFADPEVPGEAFFYQVVRMPDPPAAITVGVPDRILLTGTVVGPAGPFEGQVLVEGNLITCAATFCAAEPGATGATVIDTNGIILPGLIDAHNHGLFNIFDETDWTPVGFYGNHNQWTAEARYQQVVDAKQYLNSEGTSPVDFGCEMDKYAEIKALAAGTTSIVMAPGLGRSCYASLVRTIDTAQNDLGADRIQTSISVPSSTTPQSVCDNFASGSTDSYLVHVGEGVDPTALNEFATLAGRAGGCLLAPETAIVHGTALGAPEFATMAASGMMLVWSPRSNMFLYGDTTRIDLAIEAGVGTIALAPDWSLGGSVNLLDELRYADEIDAARYGNLLSPERLSRMVTADAARVLGLEQVIGSLEAGKHADITVIGGWRPAPYDALLLATPSSVRLVVVDGRVLYGDAGLIAAGPASPGCEGVSICGANKFLCVAETSTTNKMNQTHGEIVQALVDALADYDATLMPAGDPPLTPIAPLASCD